MEVEEEEKRRAVAELVAKLESGNSEEEKKKAVTNLRLLAKWDDDNRRYIADANGIEMLMPFLQHTDAKVQENAITALLNLSIEAANRVHITHVYGVLESILELIRSGRTPEVKENAAATLFSLLIVEEYREVVGQQPGAISALLTLLREATTHRGKKDAIKGLFHLALHDANKPRVVAAGGVNLLVSYLLQKRAGLLDESLAVLAILALCQEGMMTMLRASIIPNLVEILTLGTPKSRENAIAVLLSLCQSGGDAVISRLSNYSHQIVATLCSLLVVGSERGKRKAKALMRFLVATDSSVSSGSSYSHGSFSSGSFCPTP